MKRLSYSSSIFFLFILFFVINNSLAQTKLWTGNAGDGLWTSPTNWSDNSLPISSDDVVLDNTNVSGSYTVTLDGSNVQEIRSLQVGYTGNSNSIELVVTGGTNVLTLDRGGATALHITDGGLLDNQSKSATRGILLSNEDDVFKISGDGRYIHSTTTTGSAIPERTSETNSLNYSFALTSTFENQSGSSASFDANPTYGNYVYNVDEGNSAKVDLEISGNLSILQGTLNVTTSLTNTFFVNGDILISNGATLQGATSSGGIANINVIGNVTGEGTLKGCGNASATANITVGGNITSLISFGTGTNSLTFSGSSSQCNFTPSNSTTPTVKNITINNSHGVNLGADISIEGTLTLTNGIITTSSSSLPTISVDGNISGGSSSSFVNGPLAQKISSTDPTAKTFPIGKDADYRPLTLTVTHSSATTTTYTSEVFNSVPTSRSLPESLDRVSSVRYYHISKSTGAAVTAATIQLIYDSEGVTSASDLRIAKDDGGGNWIDIGGTGSADYTGSITSTNNFVIFSDFVLANSSGGANTLPVELNTFTASVNNNAVVLNWQTATEVNNYGFEIQRLTISNKQLDNNWIQIGFVKGNGNSNSTKNYSFTDAAAPIGNVSYKLKQVDFNGKFEYSDVVNIAVEAPTEFSLKQNYPNPFNPTTVISYQLPFTSNVSLKVFDILGREVATLVCEKQIPGNYDVKFEGSKIPSGIYVYQLKADGYIQTKKLLLLK